MLLFCTTFFFLLFSNMSSSVLSLCPGISCFLCLAWFFLDHLRTDFLISWRPHFRNLLLCNIFPGHSLSNSYPAFSYSPALFSLYTYDYLFPLLLCLLAISISSQGLVSLRGRDFACQAFFFFFFGSAWFYTWNIKSSCDKYPIEWMNGKQEKQYNLPHRIAKWVECKKCI